FGQGLILSRVVPDVVFKGDFDTQNFALRLARKDLGLATALAREFEVPMALASIVEQHMIEALARGWGERDSDASGRRQRGRAGVAARESKGASPSAAPASARSRAPGPARGAACCSPPSAPRS